MNRPMKVEWLYEARNEYRDLLSFYRNKVGLPYARAFSRKILDAAGQLAQFPESGVLRRETFPGKYGFRGLFVDKYVLIYRIEENTVFIYHLKDARTNYMYRIFGLRE